MIRIGIIEAGLTCALISLAILVPLLIVRGQARLGRLLKKIEAGLSKKSGDQVQ
jgi:hypothetical protein